MNNNQNNNPVDNPPNIEQPEKKPTAVERLLKILQLGEKISGRYIIELTPDDGFDLMEELGIPSESCFVDDINLTQLVASALVINGYEIDPEHFLLKLDREWQKKVKMKMKRRVAKNSRTIDKAKINKNRKANKAASAMRKKNRKS